jgi:hypothetical protein
MSTPVRGQLARSLAQAVRDGGGAMSAAGRWRWVITGPSGSIVLASRSRWPHRKLRYRIREATGVVIRAESREPRENAP